MKTSQTSKWSSAKTAALILLLLGATALTIVAVDNYHQQKEVIPSVPSPSEAPTPSPSITEAPTHPTPHPSIL